MNGLSEIMISHANPAQVAGLSRFFKTGPGQYGEGDKFLGIKVPVTREVVKVFIQENKTSLTAKGTQKSLEDLWKEIAKDDILKDFSSEYHEIRLASLLLLVQIYKHAKKNPRLQKECVDFYLSHTKYINNWDLVDLSCYEILGDWILKNITSEGCISKECGKDKRHAESSMVLFELARNGKTIWEQRIGIVSSMALIRDGKIDETFELAQIFLDKPKPLHDLLQKAVGWLLRETVKQDEGRCLKEWLTPRCSTMPRTMLRYAIEKFTPEDKEFFMNCKM